MHATITLTTSQIYRRQSLQSTLTHRGKDLQSTAKQSTSRPFPGVYVLAPLPSFIFNYQQATYVDGSITLNKTLTLANYVSCYNSITFFLYIQTSYFRLMLVFLFFFSHQFYFVNVYFSVQWRRSQNWGVEGGGSPSSRKKGKKNR